MMLRNICRICLTSSVKSWNLLEHNLLELYKNSTGLPISVGDGRPQLVCWECAARLRSAGTLRDKAIKAYALLDIISESIDISDYDFAKLNRNSQSDLCRTEVECYSIDGSVICKNSSVPQDEENSNFFDNYDTQNIEDKIDSDDDESLVQANFDLNDIKVYVSDTKSKIENDVQKSNISLKQNTEVAGNVKLNRKTDLNKNGNKKNSKIVKNKRTEIKNKSKSKVEMYKNMFKITKLNVDQQVAEFEKRRHKPSYVRLKYKCDNCYRGFETMKQYDDHAIKHTEAYGKFACNICKIRYNNTWFKYNHKHKETILNCTLCEFVTSCSKSAVRHMEYHLGKRYTCPHCAEVFDIYSTYMGHLRLLHPSDIVCQVCGNSYVTLQGLSLHKKMMHRLFDEKLLEDGPLCSECDVRFASPQAYLTHLTISPKHSKTPTDRKVIRRPRSAKSKDTVNKERCITKIACELCDSVFPSSTQYSYHFRKAHPGRNRTYFPSLPSPYMCDVCGKMMQTSAALRDHASRHGGAAFPCGACGKQFQQRSRLREHAKVHGERRLYACPDCGSTFTYNNNLKRHMIIHTGERPFACDICGKTFSSSDSRRCHVSGVHRNQPWPRRSRTSRKTGAGPAKGDVTVNCQTQTTDYVTRREENINE